ncbi:unnamed protein product, partial [Symbiodinium microadriaticum]
ADSSAALGLTLRCGNEALESSLLDLREVTSGSTTQMTLKGLASGAAQLRVPSKLRLTSLERGRVPCSSICTILDQCGCNGAISRQPKHFRCWPHFHCDFWPACNNIGSPDARQLDFDAQFAREPDACGCTTLPRPCHRHASQVPFQMSPNCSRGHSSARLGGCCGGTDVRLFRLAAQRASRLPDRA